MRTAQVRDLLETLIWKELHTLGNCARREELEAALDGLSEAIGEPEPTADGHETTLKATR